MKPPGNRLTLLIAALAAATLLAGPLAAGEGGIRGAKALQEAFIRVAARVSEAVVAVSVEREGPGPAPQASGVIFDAEGYVVTNEHVVRDAVSVTVVLPSGKRCKGEIRGTDPRSDLAVIGFKPPGKLATVEWGDSDKVRIGQWAVAVGNPFGFSNTVTVGVVSAVKRPLPGWALESLRGRSGRDVYYGSLIQTDASINPGNSGGALVDLDGRLIGLNSLIGADIRTGQGVGFAIPSNLVRRRVADLKAGRPVRYGWLGVRLKDLSGPLATAFGVADGGGVLVDDVVDDSPAAKAGLRRGQVVIAFGDRDIHSTDELVLLVGEAEAGSKVELKVLVPGAEGEGGIRKIEVTIAERRPSAPPDDVPPERTTFGGWRGLVLAEVEAAAGGVPIAEVESNSPAARAGLMPGDRIDEVGPRAAAMVEVNGAAGFRKAAEGLKGPVLLHCIRLGYVIVKGR